MDKALPTVMVWLLAVALLAAGRAWAQQPSVADEAQRAMNRLFGMELEKAAATESLKDDVDLSASLVEIAKTGRDTPEGIIILLCEKAFELSIQGPAGYETAVAAMRLKMEQAPGRRAEALAAICDVRQRQVNFAKPAERVAHAASLVSALLETAEAYRSREDLENVQKALSLYKRAEGHALSLYKRAERFAGQTQDPQKIRRQREEAALRLEVYKKVQQAKDLLKADRTNVAAARELIQLCVVDLDDPAEARKYAFLVADETLQARLRAAASDPSQLEAKTSLDLATWYRTLAGGAATHFAKEAMLKRSLGFLDRFLGQASDGELDTVKARLDRNQIVAELEKQ